MTAGVPVGFDPSEARDDHGRWTTGGGSARVATRSRDGSTSRTVGRAVDTKLAQRAEAVAKQGSVRAAKPATGPGQPNWPSKVPKIKDVAVGSPAEGRRLAESYTVAGGVLDKVKPIEPAVTKELTQVAAEHDGRMEGLANRFKTRDSLTRKVYTKALLKGLTPAQYGSRIGDALRYTMIEPPDELAEATTEVLDEFRHEGYTVQVENTWTKPGATYKGINTNITDRQGRTFEVQFHTQQSYAVKQKQHPLYDVARSNASTPAQIAAANRQMEANAKSLATPPGVLKIR